MTFDDFVKEVTQAMPPSGTHMRLGQLYFNTLYSFRPDLADQIRGGYFDPFHLDLRVPEFLEWVAEHWNEGTQSPLPGTTVC